MWKLWTDISDVFTVKVNLQVQWPLESMPAINPSLFSVLFWVNWSASQPPLSNYLPQSTDTNSRFKICLHCTCSLYTSLEYWSLLCLEVKVVVLAISSYWQTPRVYVYSPFNQAWQKQDCSFFYLFAHKVIIVGSTHWGFHERSDWTLGGCDD